MKKLLIILFFIPLFSLAQTKCGLSVVTYCNDTIQAPQDSIAVVAYVTALSTDPVIFRSWAQIGGAPVIFMGTGNPDSVLAVRLSPGNYVFQYTAKTKSGVTATVNDNVTVLAIPCPPPKKVVSIKTDSSGTIITFDDGTIQNL